MAPTNLSELLFKPTVSAGETSALMSRGRRDITESHSHWYRVLDRSRWAWQGMNPLETEAVLARITAAQAERSTEQWLDSVIDYRSGNWIYEWVQQGMAWQQQAMQATAPLQGARDWLQAANFYSVAAYPYLRGDELAQQAEILMNRAYMEVLNRLPYSHQLVNFPVEGGGNISGILHLPTTGRAPFPTVMVCGGLDSLMLHHQRVFSDYLSSRSIAMLVIDLPSLGASSRWTLRQDSSYLHQQVLAALPTVPWIDHQRVCLLGLRFGANIAVRLGYLASQRLRGVACLGPIVHHLLCDSQHQRKLPMMYRDVLANRIGTLDASAERLNAELLRYSLKTQGLLGRRCPTPMLAGYWRNDSLSPPAEAKLIASSSTDGAVFAIAQAPFYCGLSLALTEVCRWIQDKMR